MMRSSPLIEELSRMARLRGAVTGRSVHIFTKAFLRPQWNFTAALAPEVQRAMSPRLRYRLGLDQALNRPPDDVVRKLGVERAPS
jgi:hypothetical protein